LQLLALVDEVSVDTVTRGALKDDATFKGVRDVIKKGNRVLEEMLVRRERKYTLFFRLVQEHDAEQVERIKSWNAKVEKAVSAVTGGQTREAYASSSSASEDQSDTASLSSTSTGSISSRVGVFSRGRQLLPAAGRVRSRRATPTPRLRKNRVGGSSDDGSEGGAAADGFSTVTPMSDRLTLSHGDMIPSTVYDQNGSSQLKQLQPLEPKDELVDVIRGLRVEKQRNRDSSQDDELAAMKPSWRRKAEIPSTVPKLPTEYVHRHRLMKQVVSCLLDEAEVSKTDEGYDVNTAITCVTSRHGDKAGNGKSTLSVAVIQTVEVRERFADGIAWLKLGRGPLTEHDTRRLYEELYRQLIVKEADVGNTITEDQSHSQFQESLCSLRSEISEARVDRMVDSVDGARRFQGGDLEGIKEDLARMIVRRNILIVLDDVWRVEDVKWFIFETPNHTIPTRDSPYKILITTRIPSLLGNGTVQEIFVRILSEHEAVKLLLSTAGRRPYGGRNSAVFNQSKMIVKGCGNSPLGILLVGSMLRQSSRNWNINSPVWIGIFNQCSLNLDEAAQMRSFKNAFTRIVDMSFFTFDDPYKRVALRRCFILFAMAFRQNDWMLSGRGIPQSVILKLFETVIAAGPTNSEIDRPEAILEILENLKLIQRAHHSFTPPTTRNRAESSTSSQGNGNDNSEKSDSDWDEFDELPKRKMQQFYTMHDSLKAVAEKMVERNFPLFTPTNDSFTFYNDMISEENKIVAGVSPTWTSPLSFLFRQLKADPAATGSKQLTEEQVHELVATSLVGGGDGKAFSKLSISDAMRCNQVSIQQIDGGGKFEEYSMAFLPEHLMLARSYTAAAELLVDSDFVSRRVFALGILESTSRQVADIIELRSSSGKGASSKRQGTGESLSSPQAQHPGAKGEAHDGDSAAEFDIDATICNASRVIIEEVYKVTNSMGSSDSLGMATCLATVGDCLLKCRQPRDAMLRLEEAVSIYRVVLGPYHVYVAHTLNSVAKALTKLGETRVSLLKFAEAARIYETCNATLHYDSIANAQALASLLVDIGDIRKAEAMFEEVIAMKQTVYGEMSVPVAKTINNYAILLAKHGRMTEALRHYDVARSTYMNAPPSLIVDPEFEIKCNYDVTLITLNIASIYSKKGDLDNALQCYEEGVRGLEEYEDEMARIREMNGSREPSLTKGSSHKHLVAALGRIGSIKMKKGDQDGALEAYMMLIEEVDDDSPLTSHVEKAKAHIKCATIFRKRGGEENHATAVSHLRDALRMYKALYDPGHKDTTAIATTLKQWLTEDKASNSK
jgi:tetratricopeptide (TPR) repeat protein